MWSGCARELTAYLSGYYDLSHSFSIGFRCASVIIDYVIN